MKIEQPVVTLWNNTGDMYSHIAQCARICYASVPVHNNEAFCKALWDNNHRSMFRHAGVYYIIPQAIEMDIKVAHGAVFKLIEDKYYISANEQAAREYIDERYSKFKISLQEAQRNEIFRKYKMLRYTFCIDTSIAITREYNRKSPNNIAEQSTRYVDFIKKLGIRYLKCHWMKNCNLYQRFLYKLMLKINEWSYKLSRSKYGLNLKPEDARFILALDTMSKVVYTYTVAEWEYILNLRLFDWTGKAHPDAKIVADMIHKLLNNLGYDIKNYKENDDFKCGEI